MNVNRKTQLDKMAIQRFLRKEKQVVTIPDSIVQEYPLTKKSKGRNPGSKAKPVQSELRTPYEQYAQGEGYNFSWGHILERRMAQFIFWDFCLSNLLTQFQSRGMGLNELQRIVFDVLEAEVECTGSEPVTAVGLTDGWKIYPGTAISAFTMVIHFASEEKARDWTAETLLEEVVPKAIAVAMQVLKRNAH